MSDALSATQVERFVEDGFVHLPGVVDPATVAAGQAVIWRDLRCDPEDPSTWTAPVVRLLPSDPAPFLAAFDSARLHRAFDQLVGPGRWLPRPHLGLFVVRFPHAADPGDTGWHIDSSFPPPDYSAAEEAAFDFSRYRVNVFSRDRALLMLFLYSDVGPGDGPTRVRVGSHLDLPTILVGEGDEGITATAAGQLGAKASTSRPVVEATGAPGDVYLCHPFLVHAAQPVQGPRPRLLAQPPLAGAAPFTLDRARPPPCPVEEAIRRALDERD